MKKNKMIEIICYTCGSITVIFLLMLYFGLFDCHTKLQYFRVISDAFFVLGGIMSGIGLISFCVKEGAFVSLRKKAYSDNKSDENKKQFWLKHCFLYGIVMLLIGTLFAYL